MAENFSFGRIKAENQQVYLGTGKLLAIQDFNVNSNFGAQSLNYLGINTNKIYHNMNTN